MERHKETFNDGFLLYGRTQQKRSESRKKVGDEFVQEGRLAFKELSLRESDYQMAGMMGAKPNLKVKTPYPPSLQKKRKNTLKIIVRGVEYEVIKVDPDHANQFLYFYLQEVGEPIER